MKTFWRGVVAATALSMVALAAPAGAVTGAATGSPPVTQDDHVSLVAGDVVKASLLANDSDPDGDDLAICRIRNVPRALLVENAGGGVFLGATRPGTYTFTYYACDFSYLTPATVTVTVKPAPKMYLVVRKSTHAGMVRVGNRSDFRVHFAFGAYKRNKPDAEITVRAHTSRLVPVRRTSLIWVAFSDRYDTFRVGVIRGIALPPHVHPLPPGAPPKGTSLAFRAAARTGIAWRPTT